MLSNPLHRFSAYANFPAGNMISTDHLAQGHMHTHTPALNALAHGSHYALQLQQQMQSHQSSPPGPNGSRHRSHPYNGIGGAQRRHSAGSSTSGPVRRRISRACDQCNQLRTKCDGQTPCAHCVEFGLGCEYIRERKKRGKASRKDLAQQAAAAAAAAANQEVLSNESVGAPSPSEPRRNNHSSITSDETAEFQRSGSRSLSIKNGVGEHRISGVEQDHIDPSISASGMGSISSVSRRDQQQMSRHRDSIHCDAINSTVGLEINGFSGAQEYDRVSLEGRIMDGSITNTPYSAIQNSMPAYTEIPYAMQSPSQFSTNSPGQFRMGDSPLPNFAMASPGISPGWMSLPSPSCQNPRPHTSQHTFGAALRYPVLQPLLPHIVNIVPPSLACDLLDLYFSSSSSAHMHPMSPYILGYVFRKRSFLHPTKPRNCSPALLASMLWVAAQTSDASFFTSPPSARGRVCQKLLELTVGLLKPLIHSPSTAGDSSSDFADTDINGVALGGLGVSMPGSVGPEALSGEGGAIGAAGALDDVATYIHLATVVSASEYKGASLRWWNAAWSLARELKLGRELPQSSPAMAQEHRTFNERHHEEDDHGEGRSDLNASDSHGRGSPSPITEEEREERRRIWWLVYIVDRHLALCYNRPLFLLDLECDGLLQPVDDLVWQAGDYYTGDSSIHITSPSGTPRVRTRGPNFECTGHSIFGYFLPLMTILGEIVDLNHARNHPRFGIGFRSAQEWDDQANEISQQLDAYGRSLRHLEAQCLRPSLFEENDQATATEGTHNNHGSPSVHSVHSVNTNSSRMTESDIQTQIVLAYSTHVMHVLHILLTGKWDPISLLDDNDLWISSQSFINATGHAVSAAEAINNILEYDPGLEFMPFFFGVYLLQGSFLLLLIADKLQSEASSSVVKACETIVRAHEACVVTLNTEYQRNFRKVMRSALAQVRGRVPEDIGEQQLKRREVLALYRWTGDGTGLAL